MTETAWSESCQYLLSDPLLKQFADLGLCDTLTARMLKAPRPFKAFFQVLRIMVFVRRFQELLRRLPDGIERLRIGSKVCISGLSLQFLLTVFLSLTRDVGSHAENRRLNCQRGFF